MSDVRNKVHPVEAGNLPPGYSVMSTGTGRLKFRAYLNSKQVGGPLLSIKQARRWCTDHYEARCASTAPAVEVLEVDDTVLARLRAHREEAGRRVG